MSLSAVARNQIRWLTAKLLRALEQRRRRRVLLTVLELAYVLVRKPRASGELFLGQIDGPTNEVAAVWRQGAIAGRTDE